MKFLYLWLVHLVTMVLAGLFAVVLVSSAAFIYLQPQLPDMQQLHKVQLQTPLRIYTADHQLIAEYGEQWRLPVDYQQMPTLLVNAVLAAEDDRFASHRGVDLKSLVRASVELVQTGHIQSGGSTITMQLARNFFLTNQQSFLRKFSEIILALQIEQQLTKQQILQLYLNKVYLGKRAYGVAAAAQVYYDKPLADLNLAQYAMLAGLPKAPSSYNPIANPQRAKIRRNWVLERMYKLGYIDQMAYQQAIKVPVSARFHGPKGVVRAPYIAEMARTDLLEALGPDIYTHGYRVYTSIDSKLQQAANQALRQGLLDYSRRHGYRGPEHHLTTQDRQQWLAYLQQLTSENGLIPAVVSSVQSKSISALLADNQTTSIPWSGLSWARRYLTANRMGHKPRQASNIVKVGDVIRVQQDNQGNWQLAQVPKVQGALVSLNPNNGAIQALVGGFNFFDSHYNRAVQALRQPGSNFKPFVYAAALDQGFTPASLINDAPIVLDDQLVTRWRPRNEGGRFLGPTRLRLGLVQSRNLMSIRLMQALGIEPTINYIQRFGFTQEQLPKSLTLALGSGSTSPLDIAAGYAVFANGGYRIWPYVISSITDDAGHILYENQSPKVCKHCPQLQPGDPLFTLAGSNGREERLTSITFSQSRANQHQQPIAPQVLSPSTAYLMNSMLRDVIQWGTGRKAKVLNRFDIAGKTGTTNDQVDAWFSGFNTDLVTSVWVGFDQPQTLGRHEFGARAALPIWIDYMKVALADKAVKPFTPPEEVVAVRIDPKTGLRAYPRQKNAIVEFFPKDQEPAVTAMDPKNSVQSDYSLEHIF